MTADNYLDNLLRITDGTIPVSSDIQVAKSVDISVPSDVKAVVQTTNEDEYQEVADVIDETIDLVEEAETIENSDLTLSETVVDDALKTDEFNDKSSDKATDENKVEEFDLKSFKKLFADNEELDLLISEVGYDKFFNLIDKDGDGKITSEEIKALGLDIESLEDLTAEQIKELIEKNNLKTEEKEEDSDLVSADELEQIKKQLADQMAQQMAQQQPQNMGGSSGGSSGGGGISSGGGNNGSSGSTNTDSSGKTSTEDMSLDELITLQGEKQTAVDEASEEVAAVQSGENEAVQEAIEDYEQKQEDYEKALEEDEKVSEELKQRQEQNQEQITEKEEQISEKEVAITEAENQINTLDSQIASLDSQIAALNASLSSLPAVTEENADEVEAQRASIEADIAAAEAEKAELETEKSEVEAQKEQDEADLETYQGELETLETERAEIEEEILKSCSDETKEKLEAVQKARDNIEEVKTSELEKAQGKLETAQGELDEVNEQINELQAAQIQLENAITDDGQDVVDFAMQFNKMSAEEMKKIMREAGCQFDDGAWCADFVTFVTKQVYGNDKTPGDYANSCPNTAYCPTIGNWAKENGVLTTDSSQVKPGDFILYGSGPSYSHIEIVTSVNADGTVNTIGGNTADDNGNYHGTGVVEDHPNRTGTYVLMHKLV